MNNKKGLNLRQNEQQKTNITHLHEFQSSYLDSNKRSEILHNFTQTKPRPNVIKVNKGKLPADFFPKCTSYGKKNSNFKLDLNSPLKSQRQDDKLRPRRVESQRFCQLPDKASFFGFFQQQNSNKNADMLSSTRNISLNRKFQTRQQPKRDHSETKRRLTPATHSHRNQIYQLFKTPINYDQQITQIIQTNNSKNSSLGTICKLSPRKEHISKYQQTQQTNPEKSDEKSKQPKHLLILHNSSLSLQNYQPFSPNKKMSHINNISKGSLNGLNINFQQNNQIQKQKQHSNKLDYTFAAPGDTMDLHNMTFFNIKSSCLPPIKKY